VIILPERLIRVPAKGLVAPEIIHSYSAVGNGGVTYDTEGKAQAGDLILICQGLYSVDTNIPGGFTRIVNGGASWGQYKIYKKIATGTETTIYCGAGVYQAGGTLLIIRNVGFDSAAISVNNFQYPRNFANLAALWTGGYNIFIAGLWVTGASRDLGTAIPSGFTEVGKTISYRASTCVIARIIQEDAIDPSPWYFPSGTTYNTGGYCVFGNQG
jgi:hypothetical protein